MTVRPVRTLIVDDEELARAKLLRMLRPYGWMEATTARNSTEARAVIHTQRPELIFLDIEMPGTRGHELAASLDAPPLIVFTTAHPEFAVEAFDVGAVDYLTKPILPERLELALDRVRAQLAATPDAHAERLFVRSFGRLIPVTVSDIRYLQSDGDYVHIHVTGRSYCVRTSLKELAGRLDPQRFLRVHRQTVVNLDRVVSFDAAPASTMTARLDDNSRLRVSRRHSKRLRQRGLC